MTRIILRGGLGNQMFQYALGLNLSLRNKTPLVLDTTFLNDRFPRKEFTYRTLDLDVFGVPQNITVLSKLSAAIPIPGVWLGLDLAATEVSGMLGMHPFIKEKKAQCFDPSVLEARGDVALWGFWQTEKYFSDIKDVIRETFRFHRPLDGEAAAIAGQIETENSVAIHVRRNDYVKFPGMEKLMGTTSISYYTKAMAYIAERVTSPHFFIFSDDVVWCKQNITPMFPTTYLTSGSAGPKGSFHLQLMSLCCHNVIANSTFSWWGAWLNRNSKKIVVAPAHWTADATDGEEVIPEDWVKIST